MASMLRRMSAIRLELLAAWREHDLGPVPQPVEPAFDASPVIDATFWDDPDMTELLAHMRPPDPAATERFHVESVAELTGLAERNRAARRGHDPRANAIRGLLNRPRVFGEAWAIVEALTYGLLMWDPWNGEHVNRLDALHDPQLAAEVERILGLSHDVERDTERRRARLRRALQQLVDDARRVGLTLAAPRRTPAPRLRLLDVTHAATPIHGPTALRAA